MSERIFTLYVFIMLLGTFFKVSAAYATSCSKEYISLEMAYLTSDVIFSGYVLINEENETTEFKVTELFKDSIRGSNTNIEKLKYYNDGSGVIGSVRNFDPNVEYIFYGEYFRDDDNWLVQFSPCSKTKVSIEERIKIINTMEEDPNTTDYSRVAIGSFIFKGKVLKRDIIEKFVTHKPNHKEIPIAKSTVEFEVIDIYKNQILDREKEQIKKISVHVGWCGDEYKLGEEYLVYIDGPFYKKDINGQKNKEFRDTCKRPMGALHVAEKAFLRDLSVTNIKRD